jgi:hypothetical protein
MATRRTFLTGLSGVAFGVAGCIDLGAPGEESGDGRGDEQTGDEQDDDETAPAERNDEPSFYLRAAPADVDDGLESALSTDEPAVADIEPLLDVIEETVDTFEVVRQPVSPEDAEAFEAVTADAEYHFAGNPPGYYIEHGKRRVSVTLTGG